MSKIDDGGAAFPIDSYMLNPNATEKEIKEAQGMTLRDYFAAAALQGMMGNCSLVDTFSGHAVMAEKSYFLADAMIEARKGEA
jgi:hypothetical protein